MATKIQSIIFEQAGEKYHAADCPNCGRRHAMAVSDNKNKSPVHSSCACGMLLHLDPAHEPLTAEQFHADLIGSRTPAA
jgi:hypothetical protein